MSYTSEYLRKALNCKYVVGQKQSFIVFSNFLNLDSHL